MLRGLLDATTHLALRLRRARVVTPKGDSVKVNLGSGLGVRPGWINVDASLSALVAKWPAPIMRAAYELTSAKKWYGFDEYMARLRSSRFIHHDLTRGLPFTDNTVDYIYTHHFIHLIYRDETERLLDEAHRVLKPGGLLRVAVPNLEEAFAMYQRGETEQALASFFGSGVRDGDFSQYRYLYDFQLMRDLMQRAGFQDIHRCERAIGAMPEIEAFETRSPGGLYVEARAQP